MFCTFISVATGSVTEGVIVNRNLEGLRIFAPGLEDAIELRGAGTDWVTDAGDAVRFEFLGSDLPCADTVCAPPLATRAAGSAAV